MVLSSSELSGSMSFSFAFSVLSLNIRTSSWRRSLTTALVWLAADAGRSFSLKNRHINLEDAFHVCVFVYSMFVCVHTVLTCHRCCAGWTGWAKLAQGCCLHHHHPHFGSVTFYCLSGHINIVGSTLRPCSCFLLQWKTLMWLWYSLQCKTLNQMILHIRFCLSTLCCLSFHALSHCMMVVKLNNRAMNIYFHERMRNVQE